MRKLLVKGIGPVLAVLVAALLVAAPGASARGQEIAAAKQGTGFTCPMHPEVRQPKPGKCPLCSMDLIAMAPLNGWADLKPGQRLHLGGRDVVVKEMTALPLVKNWCSERYKFDCFDSEDLKTLRKQEKLDAVTAKGRTEFQKQVLLLDWAYKRFKLFGSPTKKEARGKPLEIVKAIDQGHAFDCGYYATLLRTALKSCGYVARGIGLKGAKSDGNGTEHGVVEVWSNDYRKWIVLDPTLNVYFKKGGVPLNAYEIRQEWFYNDGKALEIIIGAEGNTHTKADLPIARGTHKGFGTLKIKPESIGKFLYIAYTPVRPDGKPDYGQMFIIKDKLCEGVKYHTRRNPEKPAEEPYFPVQQAALKLTPAGGAKIAVGVDTLTPDFETYRWRIDNGKWTDGKPGAWTLHKGTNTLEVRSVNKFGVAGRPSKVVLEMR